MRITHRILRRSMLAYRDVFETDCKRDLGLGNGPRSCFRNWS
jgi:hypothetical protein